MNATATVRQTRRKLHKTVLLFSGPRGRHAFARRGGWTASVVVAAALSMGCPSATGSIGAHLGKRNDGRLFVRYAPSEMTGAKAGLAPGDEVVLIEGRDVRQMSPEDIRNALRGKVGTTVTLTVKRDGLSRDVRVERGPFAKGD